MKIKGLLVLLVMAVLVGCGADDVAPFDPEAQLERDIEVIDEHLASKGINAEEDRSGIRYVITKQGVDENPAVGDSVWVDYELFNFSDEMLDTSIEDSAREGEIYNPQRTYQPLAFILGTNNLIPGFQRATILLKKDGEGDFYIPSVYAYGPQGQGNIKPNENLLFKMTLLKIKKNN